MSVEKMQVSNLACVLTNGYEKSRLVFFERRNLMKHALKFFAFLALLFSAFSTFSMQASAQMRNEILIVADRKASCRGVVAQDCLQIKRLNEERFNVLRQNIDGFRYAPGFYYVLEVRSSNTGYRLYRILAQVRTDDVAQPIPLPFPQNLSGVEWRLTRIEGRTINSEKAMIKFDQQNDRVSGNGGCNAFGGTLRKNGSEIRIGQVISTKMFCQDSSDIENQFFRNLDRVTRYSFVSGNLQLFSGNRVILEFSKK